MDLDPEALGDRRCHRPGIQSRVLDELASDEVHHRVRELVGTARPALVGDEPGDALTPSRLGALLEKALSRAGGCERAPYHAAGDAA
jgi:hypothetical protein